MLKIRDNVNLKDLEKFGFKPKYSEKNGELIEYFFVNNKETSISMFLGIQIVKKDVGLKKKRKLRILKTFRRDHRGVPLVKEGKIWIIDNYNYHYTDFDILYDLIQAGLLEKVNEESK